MYIFHQIYLGSKKNLLSKCNIFEQALSNDALINKFFNAEKLLIQAISWMEQFS